MAVTKDEFIQMCKASNIDISEYLSDIDVLMSFKKCKIDPISKSKISRLMKNAENISKKDKIE